MSRILVLGGTGYLGRLLVPALLRAKHDVTVLCLDTGPAATQVRLVLGSRHDVSLMQRLSEEERFDGIVDLIAYHEADVTRTVETWSHAPHRLSRYVLLSTLAAVESFRTPLATEQTALAINGPDNDYGSGKAACERALVSAAWRGFPGVILRAAPIFGPGDPVSRENYVLQRVLLGLPIPCSTATNASVVRVFARDLIHSMVSCFARPIPAGRIYHLVQRENVTFEHYVQSIADFAGRSVRLELVRPEQLGQAGLNPASIPLGGSDPTIRFSIDRAIAELGFRPTPFSIALKETMESIQNEGAFTHAAWPGRACTQSRLAGTQQHLQLEVERALWNGEQCSALDDDEVIRSLVEAGGCTTIAFEDWPVYAQREASTPTQRAVVLPQSLRDWLLSPPNPPVGNEQPILQAAIEPTGSPSGTEFYLYSRALLRRARGYTFGNSPVTLRLCRFRELGRVRPASAGERILVAVHDREDADALLAWLSQWEHEKAVLVSDVRALARIHLVDSKGWASLSGGAGWQAELRATLARSKGNLGQWCGVFAACRRLRREALAAEPLRLQRLDREAILSSQ